MFGAASRVGQRSQVYNGSSSSQRWERVECVFNEVGPLRQAELEVHLEQAPWYQTGTVSYLWVFFNLPVKNRMSSLPWTGISQKQRFVRREKERTKRERKEPEFDLNSSGT